MVEVVSGVEMSVGGGNSGNRRDAVVNAGGDFGVVGGEGG